MAYQWCKEHSIEWTDQKYKMCPFCAQSEPDRSKW